MQHPLVQAIIETFPEARLVARRERKAPLPAEPIPDDLDEGADER
jgi:hypothetical protein